jgi:hypothetical protein
MLKEQTDYSNPEKQQELRSFVGELDNTAFKDCNGSEVMITTYFRCSMLFCTCRAYKHHLLSSKAFQAHA